MKNIIIIAAATLLSTNVTFAQDLSPADVPSVVMSSFNKSFPKSSSVEWELKGDNYNAEFDLNRRDHEVWISKTGAIVKHKKELKPSEIPATVSTAIKRSYDGFRIDDVDRYEVNKQFYYKMELKKLNEERNVVFDQKGAESTIVL